MPAQANKPATAAKRKRFQLSRYLRERSFREFPDLVLSPTEYRIARKTLGLGRANIFFSDTQTLRAQLEPHREAIFGKEQRKNRLALLMLHARVRQLEDWLYKEHPLAKRETLTPSESRRLAWSRNWLDEIKDHLALLQQRANDSRTITDIGSARNTLFRIARETDALDRHDWTRPEKESKGAASSDEKFIAVVRGMPVREAALRLKEQARTNPPAKPASSRALKGTAAEDSRLPSGLGPLQQRLEEANKKQAALKAAMERAEALSRRQVLQRLPRELVDKLPEVEALVRQAAEDHDAALTLIQSVRSRGTAASRHEADRVALLLHNMNARALRAEGLLKTVLEAAEEIK